MRYVQRTPVLRKKRKALADRLREVRRLAQAGYCESAHDALMRIADSIYYAKPDGAEPKWTAVFSAIDRCRRRVGGRKRDR